VWIAFDAEMKLWLITLSLYAYSLQDFLVLQPSDEGTDSEMNILSRVTDG
jgi:hypothetical protein